MWDSNPQAQQASGRRPKSLTAVTGCDITKNKSHYLLLNVFRPSEINLSNAFKVQV
jgi:hypothetical protein